ncbi:MAG: 5'-methylthioadenosine/S-adenosylhomocysteine nucleosidase [Prevotella sp.]|nr:5'-methylthioadenosine/S-adenosylhomocysteine nucleosidase [Prevotella sp.]
MKIGIIVAMEKELRELQKVFGDDPRYVIMQCGIGKVNAAIGAAEMIRQHHPDAIISSGCAGGNGDNLKVQDVVVSTELAYHDVYCGEAVDGSCVYGQVQGMPARFQADPNMLAVAKKLSTINSPLSTVFGLIVTGDWFVDSREKMRQIIEKFPDAKAVDMESCAIAQTCHIYGVPFISFRIISDIPLSDTNASQYHDFWSQMADRSFHVTRAFVEALASDE